MWLLACAGELADPSDAHDWIEGGDENFAIAQTLLVECTDAEGAPWAYVHAEGRLPGGCGAEGSSFTCDSLRDAVGDCEVSGVNGKRHQLHFWFNEWNSQWPVESSLVEGAYTGCPEPGTDPPGFDTNISHATFTPDEYSDELLVGGGLHGVLNVTRCD